MEIKLPPDLEAELEEEARLSGYSVEKLIIICVAEHFAKVRRVSAPSVPPPHYKPEDFPPGSMGEFLAPFIGVIDSSELGPEAQKWLPLSENTGEKFTEILLEKQRQGRL
ncbi:MAG TPA: hypothetical protein VHG08_05450 [Longimicrobium sp.]|nr:hypothetical protein [Longimicrobium sp.]